MALGLLKFIIRNPLFGKMERAIDEVIDIYQDYFIKLKIMYSMIDRILY